MLCEEKALSRPLLYLSLYLKAHRAEYYDRLTAIRLHGHWEQWLMFFLRGVSTTALAATQTAKDIVALRDAHRSDVAKNAKALTLLTTCSATRRCRSTVWPGSWAAPFPPLPNWWRTSSRAAGCAR